MVRSFIVNTHPLRPGVAEKDSLVISLGIQLHELKRSRSNCVEFSWPVTDGPRIRKRITSPRFTRVISRVGRPFWRPIPRSRKRCGKICRGALARNIKRISAETWEKINRILLGYAKDKGIESGERVRIDPTVTETNIHAPTCVRTLRSQAFREYFTLPRRTYCSNHSPQMGHTGR